LEEYRGKEGRRRGSARREEGKGKGGLEG